MADYIVGTEPGDYATVQNAVAAAEAVGPAGGVARVRVRAATLAEKNIAFSIDWTQTAWLSVESFSGARDVIMDLSAGVTNDKVFICNSKRALRFSNIELHANGGSGSRYGFQNFTNAGRMKNVLMHHFFQALSGACMQIIFEDCESHTNTYDGFLSSGYNVYFRCKAHHNTRSGFGNGGRFPDQYFGCTAWRNGWNGFHFSYSGNTEHYEHLLYNCVSLANTQDGLNIVATGTCVRVIDCIFRSNTLFAIRLPAPRSTLLFDPLPRCEANCYSGNGSGILYDGTNTVTDLAGMQTYTGQDALSTVADPLLTNEGDGTEDFDLQAASPCTNAGIGAGVQLDWKGVAFPDPHHPAIGCAANRDVEIDVFPSLPTVQPVLDSVVCDQATGAVTLAWSPGHAGAHIFGYRRRRRVAQKTLVGELSGAGPHDDLSALPHDTYYYSVSQELDDGGSPSGFPGRPDSAELALDWTGETPEYSPPEDLAEQLADCAAWQSWCATADRAVALAHTHLQVYEPTNEASERPYAVILDAEQLRLEEAGLGAWIPSGSVAIKITALAEGETEAARVEAFAERLRAVQQDLAELSGRDNHRAIKSITPQGDVVLLDQTERQAGNLVTGLLLVEWGI